MRASLPLLWLACSTVAPPEVPGHTPAPEAAPEVAPEAVPEGAPEASPEPPPVLLPLLAPARFAAPPAESFRPRQVTVALPRGYDVHIARRYPVVYAFDGQAALDGGLDLGRAVDALQIRGAIEPHLIVAIDTTSERSRELTSDAVRFGEWIFEVLKPVVDERFRTRPDAASTALVGYSFGGLAALRIFLARRGADVGRLVCMSSSFWWRRRKVVAEVAAYDGPLPTRLWIDAGTRETAHGATYMVTDARAVRDRLVDHGARLGVDLGYLEEEGARHGHAWGGLRTERALAFALSR